jgi:hypothetical protein
MAAAPSVWRWGVAIAHDGSRQWPREITICSTMSGSGLGLDLLRQDSTGRMNG